MNRLVLHVFGGALILLFSGCAAVPDFQLSERDGNVGFALAPEIITRILRPPNISRILEVNEVEYLSATYRDNETKKKKGYGLLRIKYSIQGDFGFEAISYREMYLARPPEDPDWSKAVQFFLPRDVEFDQLREMHPDELTAIVSAKNSSNRQE